MAPNTTTVTTSSVAAAAAAAAAVMSANVSAAAAAGLYMPQTYSFLSPDMFETLVKGYISQLHVRKRNKALISQQLANDCLMVLTNPENTAIFNPKFRWWVRKHFVFTVVGELRILMDKKNGKPVCVREQLYDKVCYFHHIIGHGGRDKTFAAITKSYSKVPAELVSLFTKNCQTCLGVRKYSKNKRPILNEFEYPSHPQQATPQPQPQQQQQQQQQQAQQHHHHHHSQQQQQQQHHVQQEQQQHAHAQQQHAHVHHHQHPHAHHLQLTCNTSGFNSSGQHASLHSMMKPEHGTISPISPIMSHSGSSFFGSNHLHNAYSQHHHQHHHHQQAQTAQQQHQLQQHHHVALATHLNMSMSLSDMSMGGHLTGANNNHDSTHGFPSPTTANSTPTLLTKIELPLHHLLQQQQQQQHLINTGLHSPTDLPDHHFTTQQQVSSPTCSSVGAYSPTLQEQYPSYHSSSQQHQQQQQQQSQVATNDYSHPFSSYSAAAATAAALSLGGFSTSTCTHSTHDVISSPVLSQAQLFQKQIQQDHQRYQQQQHRFLPDTMMGTSSVVPSAVPSMCSSIPTPTTGSPLDLMTGGDEEEDESMTLGMAAVAAVVERHQREQKELQEREMQEQRELEELQQEQDELELNRCDMSAVVEMVAAQL